MSEIPDGTYAVKNAMATLAAAGLFVVGAAVACSATAAADPAPPEVPGAPAVAAPAPAVEPPAPPGPEVPIVGAPLGSNGLSVLAQTGAESAPGRLGAPGGIDMSPGALLGQYATPSAPGGPPPTNAPNLRAFNNGNFLPQNEKPSAPGQGTVVGVEPGQENADISGLDWMRHMREMYHNGNLRGAMLGQTPKEQLGEPLPGTAPPPGTNIPAGLGENLPDPAAPPPAPGVPVPAPPAPPAP
ncbi:hypothetical protein [Mycolicibacterium septicum]|uniref:hypothetical protein n=1 Tax=Mycolicibacterium septicum TaxID=98668 RepID=UPI001AFAE490|nr:hypothetical protein [Mycolicibacterium septicum]QRY50813.1 hypothetical protein JVX95_25725 [Mycolicibacterium septicum]